MSLFIFFERHHTAGHPVVYEFIVFLVVTAGTCRCAYPNGTVARSEERVDTASLFFLQMIGAELSGVHIKTHQSIMGTYPNAFVVIFGQRSHIVVGQNAWRIGIAAKVMEGIAVIAQ